MGRPSSRSTPWKESQVSESADDHEHDDEEHEHDEDEVDEAAQEALQEMLDTIRQAKVGPLILSTVSTFASVAYGKIEMKDLSEAKTAIDVIDALLPLLGGDVDVGVRTALCDTNRPAPEPSGADFVTVLHPPRRRGT